MSNCTAVSVVRVHSYLSWRLCRPQRWKWKGKTYIHHVLHSVSYLEDWSNYTNVKKLSECLHFKPLPTLHKRHYEFANHISCSYIVTELEYKLCKSNEWIWWDGIKIRKIITQQEFTAWGKAENNNKERHNYCIIEWKQVL